MPLLFGPKAKVRQALEAAGIPHTYIVSYGFATYWANGLGELGQRDRVPPAPTGDNKVPYFGSGRTKCALSDPASLTLPTCMHRHSEFMCLCAQPLPFWRPHNTSTAVHVWGQGATRALCTLDLAQPP